MKEKNLTDEKMRTSPVGIPESSNNAASNNATSNNAVSNNAASNNAASNNAASNNAASNNAASNNAASNNAASNNAASNNAASNNAASNNAASNNAASNNAASNNAASNNAASNNATSNNAASNNAASNSAASNSAASNNAASNNATPNNAASNNAASNNAASNNAASNNPASHSAASNNATANNKSYSTMTSNTTSLQAGDGAGFYTSVVSCSNSSPIFYTQKTVSTMAGEGLHRSNSESKNDGSSNDDVDGVVPILLSVSANSTSPMACLSGPFVRSASEDGICYQATINSQPTSTGDSGQEPGLTPGEELDSRLFPLTVGSQIPGISIRPRDIPETAESINEIHHTIYEMSGMGCKGPENPEFAEFSARQRTFETWDADQSVGHDLAHAGFFYAGYADCVRCFYCNGLRQWRRQDNPLIEHARWSPNCRYIQHLVGPDFISAVRILEKNNNNITLESVAEYMCSMGQPLGSWFHGLMKTDMAAVQPLIDEGYDPGTVIRTAVSLRRNGVIPSADIILRKLKKENSRGGASAKYTPNSAHEETLSAMKRENDFLRKRIICIRCNFKEVGIIFLPCGHLITCPECSFTCSRCPLCNESILGTVRSYI